MHEPTRRIPVKRFGYEVPHGMRGHKKPSSPGDKGLRKEWWETSGQTIPFIGCRMIRNSQTAAPRR